MTYLQAAEKYIPEGREDILDQFIHNAEVPLHEETNGSAFHFLESAFTWAQTPQGHKYWQGINSTIHDKLTFTQST